MVERVVVAGGGVGALEGVLALQALAPWPPVYLQRRMRMPLSSGAHWWPEHKVAGRHLGPYLASLGSSR